MASKYSRLFEEEDAEQKLDKIDSEDEGINDTEEQITDAVEEFGEDEADAEEYPDNVDEDDLDEEECENKNPIAKECGVKDEDFALIIKEARKLDVFDEDYESDGDLDSTDFFNEGKKFINGAERVKKWKALKANFMTKSFVLATAKAKNDAALKQYYLYKSKMQAAYEKMYAKYNRAAAKKAKKAIKAELAGKSGVRADTPNIKTTK